MEEVGLEEEDEQEKEESRSSPADDSSLDLVENAELRVAAEDSARATRAAQRGARFPLPDTH